MRLFSKVFFSIALILSLSLALSGTLLMSASFHDAMNREISRAVDSFQMSRFILQSSIRNQHITKIGTDFDWENAVSDLRFAENVSIYSLQDKEALYARMPFISGEDVRGNLSDAWDTIRPEDTSLYYEVLPYEDRTFLTVGGVFYAGSERFILTTSSDVSSVITQNAVLQRRYRLVYLLVSALGLAVISFFSWRFVRPIDRMAKAAGKIASGDYEARVSVESADEMGDLSKSFNHMAARVERSVEDLKRNAEEKEDFVGNFAHELKTPLTSVIGYADMLAQKDLSKEEVHTYAGFILDEGMRLEALSYKLMELIVLNRQDFVFEELPAKEILANVRDSVAPLFADNGVEGIFESDDIDLRVEFDLFKTMLLNLIDNAVKAGASRVDVRCVSGDGLSKKTVPLLIISDNGRGIPPDSLERITEAFYMVDKSRSRAQHGAGLGLALVKRIADLHGVKLTFESKEGVGTTVTLTCDPGEDREADG